jgi:hypothetical protein
VWLCKLCPAVLTSIDHCHGRWSRRTINSVGSHINSLSDETCWPVLPQNVHALMTKKLSFTFTPAHWPRLSPNAIAPGDATCTELCENNYITCLHLQNLFLLVVWLCKLCHAVPTYYGDHCQGRWSRRAINSVGSHINSLSDETCWPVLPQNVHALMTKKLLLPPQLFIDRAVLVTQSHSAWGHNLHRVLWEQLYHLSAPTKSLPAGLFLLVLWFRKLCPAVLTSKDHCHGRWSRRAILSRQPYQLALWRSLLASPTPKRYMYMY